MDAAHPAEVDPSTTRASRGPHVPVRTCLGCRCRDARSSLLRLVAQVTPPSSAKVLVVPDPAGHLPGRGAWIHPTSACLDVAVRKRAVGRALRLTAGVDLDEIRAYVAASETDRQDDVREDAGNDHR